MTGYRKWGEVREERAAEFTEAERAQARDEVLAERTAYRLVEMRREAGLNQTELAKVMGVSLHRVSVIERGDPHSMELDTVRRYVEALGGKVKVTAEFGDRSIGLLP